MPYVKVKEASKFYKVHPQTIRRWTSTGKVKFRWTVGKQRLIYIEKESSKEFKKESIIYIRVSSYKQKDDLKRQQEFMVDKYPGHTVVKDIGSGLNFKRKGLLSLLERAEKGELSEVVVSSKDRLCRFGYDLLEWLFNKHNVKLLVLKSVEHSPEQEFTEDLLSIVQVFSCRWNGSRRYSIKDKKNKNATKKNS